MVIIQRLLVCYYRLMLRSNIKKFFTKVILILIAGVFVLWGTGNNFSSNHSDMGEINGEKISIQEWQRYLHSQISIIQQNIGRNLSSSEINDKTFQSLLMGKFINDKLIQEEAKRLGFIVDDNTAKYTIANTSSFLTDGKFDRHKFSSILQSNNLSESQFLDAMRSELEVAAIKQILDVDKIIPDIMVKHILNARMAERNITKISIPLAVFNINEKPTEEKIQNIMMSNKHIFGIPEKRSVSYIQISNTDVQDAFQKPSNIELEDYYNTKKIYFTEPESREVLQIIVKSEEDALNAIKKIGEGESFSKLAQKISIKKDMIKIGKVHRDSLDKHISDIIFSTNEGDVSKPFYTPFGWHVIKVTKIAPKKLQSFKSVMEKVRNLYNKEKQRDILIKLSRDIDAEVDNGLTLEEVASKYNLKIKKRSGITKKDKSKLSTISFDLSENETSSVTPTKEMNSFIIVRLEEIKKEHLKKVKDMMPQVLKSWKHEQQVLKAQEVSNKIYDSIFSDGLSKGSMLQKYSGIKFQDMTISYFTKNTQGISQALRSQILKMKEGGISQPIYDAEQKAYTMLYINNIEFAENAKMDQYKDMVRLELLNQQFNIYYQELIRHLRSGSTIKTFL